MVMCSVVASNVKYGSAADQLKNATALSALAMASTVLMIAILFVGFYDWRNILSLIVSIVTNVVASIFIYLDRKGDSVEGVKLPVLSIFAVLWIIVVIIGKSIDSVSWKGGNEGTEMQTKNGWLRCKICFSHL